MSDSNEMFWKGPGVLNLSRGKTVEVNGLIPEGVLDPSRIKKFKASGMITDHPSQVVVSGDEALKQTIQDLRKTNGSLVKENRGLKTQAERVPSLEQKLSDLNAILESVKADAKKEGKGSIFEKFFGKGK